MYTDLLLLDHCGKPSPPAALGRQCSSDPAEQFFVLGRTSQRGGTSSRSAPSVPESRGTRLTQPRPHMKISDCLMFFWADQHEKVEKDRVAGAPTARSMRIAVPRNSYPINQARTAITSRYSASTNVISSPPRLCSDHNVSSSVRSSLAASSPKEVKARFAGP